MNYDDSPVTFIRKAGKVIPIHQPVAEHVDDRNQKLKQAAAAIHSTANSVKEHVDEGLTKLGLHYDPSIHVNHRLDMLGLGLSVAAGVVGAATFGSKAKGFIGGIAAAHGIDALGTASNIASVSGRGFKKERVKQGARQEARNFIIGNGVFVGGLLAVKRNRQRLGKIASNLVSFGKRAIME